MKKNVENVIQKIKNLPSGTETSITKLLGDFKTYSDEELTNICYKVFEICEKENIELDFSKNEDQKSELIYNRSFIKKNKIEVKEAIKLYTDKFGDFHIFYLWGLPMIL